MRQAIGSTEIFKYVLIFTLIFVTFVTLAISYNKIIKCKNEVINIIEKYEASNDSLVIINNYLTNRGYNTKGKCDSDYKGVDISDDNNNQEHNYCLRRNNDGEYVTYDVVLFYKFNLPVLGDLMTFEITGKTDNIIKLKDEQIGGNI